MDVDGEELDLVEGDVAVGVAVEGVEDEVRLVGAVGAEFFEQVLQRERRGVRVEDESAPDALAEGFGADLALEGRVDDVVRGGRLEDLVARDLAGHVAEGFGEAVAEARHLAQEFAAQGAFDVGVFVNVDVQLHEGRLGIGWVLECGRFVHHVEDMSNVFVRLDLVVENGAVVVDTNELDQGLLEQKDSRGSNVGSQHLGEYLEPVMRVLKHLL